MDLLFADSTSLQASEWAAFAPHRIQQVAVPTRRTLDFDVQADSELQPEAQHESEPDLESHQPESCSHMPNSYSHMSTQPEYQPQFESQHAQQSNLQAQQEHKHVPFADVPEKPEAAFQSQPQATAGPTTNGFSATTDATNATATPQNTSHSFAMELSTPTVGDRGHPGLSMVPVGPFAAAAEPETPSARDIAHKGPALPFAPEWSHSTAGSCTGKVADTAASWSEADQPVDVTQPKSYLGEASPLLFDVQQSSCIGMHCCMLIWKACLTCIMVKMSH